MTRPERFLTVGERLAIWLDRLLNIRIEGLTPVAMVVGVVIGVVVTMVVGGCASPVQPRATRTVVQHVTIECAQRACGVVRSHGQVHDRNTDTDLDQFPVQLNVVGAADTSGLGGVGDFGFNIFYTLTNVSAAGVGCTTQSCNSAVQPGTQIVALGSVDETIGDRPITLYNFNTADTLEVTSPVFLAYEMTEENGVNRDSVLAGSGFSTKGQPVANNVICAFGPGVTVPSATQGSSLTGNPCVNPGHGAAPYELTFTFNQTDEPATWRITLAIVTQVASTMDASLPTPLRLFGGI